MVRDVAAVVWRGWKLVGGIYGRSSLQPRPLAALTPTARGDRFSTCRNRYEPVRQYDDAVLGGRLYVRRNFWQRHDFEPIVVDVYGHRWGQRGSRFRRDEYGWEFGGVLYRVVIPIFEGVTGFTPAFLLLCRRVKSAGNLFMVPNTT